MCLAPALEALGASKGKAVPGTAAGREEVPKAPKPRKGGRQGAAAATFSAAQLCEQDVVKEPVPLHHHEQHRCG